ncbi:MAG TPA: lamin tail domain-containing protein, partial [Methylomirabilota bacterium]|nr:lamin tail domain-containing protein [Methylomirabilota bacterium]
MKPLSRILLSGVVVLSAQFLPFTGRAAAPVIQSIVPAPGSTVSSLSQITITFSAPVAGVQASDLQINGLPALGRTGTNAVAIFQFSQPPPGQVVVNFDSDATITDPMGNPFDPLGAGTAWSYTLADTVAPTVAASEPAPGAVIGALSQIEVVFTEPVTGVEASDLRVNGVAAAAVSELSPDRYRFSFAPPPSGAVSISWAAGHGIRDRSPAANAFAGAGWSYTLNPAAAAGDVVINEFLAENQNGLEDADGQKEDWIELFNRGASAVNLTGWSLTDDPAQPGKWVFPTLTLGAGQYLLVLASGKDRKTSLATATNHTSFRLNVAGGYLGLFDAGFPRRVVSQFSDYPPQRADVSYGLGADGAVYFAVPTPRAANNLASAAAGFVAPPHASERSGFFNQPFQLALSTETPGAEIHYTLDGSVPTLTNEPYLGPITIAGTPGRAVVTVRAAAFKPGQVPSSVTTRTFIFPDHVLSQPANPEGFPSIWDSPCTGFNNCNDINPADYEMDPQVITNTVDNYRALARQGLVSIPTVSIVTDVKFLFGAAEGVYVRREPFLRKPVNAEFILPDGSEGWQIDCGLEMQGQTSPDDSSTGGSRWKSLKLGLRLFFQGEFGPTKLKYKVFEDSPVDEFDTLMLAGGHNNYWNYNNNDTQRTRAMYVRDQYVADLQNALGGRTHHGRFVHLYLNGLYWGLYQLHERPDESFMASYFGGRKEDYDVFKHDSGQVVAGSSASYGSTSSPANNGTLWGIINAGLTNNANYELLQQRLDVPDLINYLLVNYWANNTDWAHKNLYASRHKQEGKWRFHAWDSEHVLASADFDVLSDNEGSNPTAIFNRLLTNAEFRVLLGDHIHRHFFNDGIFYTDPANPVYNPAFPERNRPAHRFMQMLQQIDTAIVCESARWGDVGPGRENNPHTRNGSFYEERDILMGYRATFGSHSPVFFPSRSTNLLNQFRTRGWYPSVVAPTFNQHGGRVAAGFNLTMTAPAGTIYYTTNGSDPRVYGSGAVSPQAVGYGGGPVVVNRSMVVKARALWGTNWSALNEATFTVAELVSPLRVTEIMYNPVGGDAYEFIELQNTGGLPVEVGGYYFEGISYVFGPGVRLAPGAVIVLANNGSPAAFAARYPGVVVAGYFGGSLANGGERIALRDAGGRLIWSVDYDDEGGWPVAADGLGASLEMEDVDGDGDDPANWRA